MLREAVAGNKARSCLAGALGCPLQTAADAPEIAVAVLSKAAHGARALVLSPHNSLKRSDLRRAVPSTRRLRVRLPKGQIGSRPNSSTIGDSTAERPGDE